MYVYVNKSLKKLLTIYTVRKLKTQVNGRVCHMAISPITLRQIRPLTTNDCILIVWKIIKIKN